MAAGRVELMADLMAVQTVVDLVVHLAEK
jgi:hypothetical protein